MAANPHAAWHVIYNLDGSFRGYEWALDAAGNLQPSRVYEQEGRCGTCGGLWPEFCSCPDRDDEVEARDERNGRDDG